jgi:hypothetical protein
MKERYSHELPVWMRLLGIWRINTGSVDTKWGYFAPRFGFEIKLHRGGYFDQRYAVTICLLWGVFHVYLPFKTSLEEGCESPDYGLHIHGDTFWIYTGRSSDGCGWITWNLPFFSYIHDGWRVQRKDGSWVSKSDSWKDEEPDGRHIESHPYKYTLSSGEVQQVIAEIHKCSLKWHRKWFPWLTMVRTSIQIDFSGEVGEGTGSWKGGTVGCSYDVVEGETMLQTLSRMESERRFDR